MTLLRPLALLLLMAALAGCGAAPAEDPPPTVDFSQPPAIRFGEATSYPDGRVVTEARFAAVYLTPGGETRLYDDIGRMAAALGESGEAPAAVWLHDYETEQWLPAGQAFLVASPNLVTPRGSGIVAVDSLERAELLAQQTRGRVLAWAAVPAYIAAGPTEPLSQPSGGFEMGGLLEAER